MHIKINLQLDREIVARIHLGARAHSIPPKTFFGLLVRDSLLRLKRDDKIREEIRSKRIDLGDNLR